MDLEMWRHAAIKQNISRLKQYGNRIIPPGYGELASGLTGEGRLAEPEEIVAFIGQEIKEINGAQGSASTGVTTGGPAGKLNGKRRWSQPEPLTKPTNRYVLSAIIHLGKWGSPRPKNLYWKLLV